MIAVRNLMYGQPHSAAAAHLSHIWIDIAFLCPAALLILRLVHRKALR
ncbi:hypothetical protein MM1S1540310_4348 [Mycobacteroides abscessus subsp. bolletii 1S-154-0310]|uniref:Uncharacterized protein n=3 Tax=Mycobacteroides abscessus TaxID=36809 RepID=A0A829M526_9MYCO|nr:hypothetical protein MASS_4732 [Mycobacteroides abscessus subsp. bolletii 50594]EIU04812.1 hypothetical protein MA5S0422_5339 [Mycobacteroides abscessus 5S-0422]EIU08164.1 hypothetical protein MA5S0421_4421 [Mycobacteroides abscessus 5S-0421]EIU08873.1 hypothetical protein MA5S0304_4165 [Mycobacteroides abscessus 5S-0304]EIU20959.1 hypothetical protein MA5S0708_4092 [Mycobacteroides abscessus 5S-0708]EIU30045.1 hypothetical protein MA5S1212_3849 [Mycobacteroides abscessus 5S-1212]EIU58111.